MTELLERLARLSPAKRSLLLSHLPGGAIQRVAKLLPNPLTPMSVREMNREAELDSSLDYSAAAGPQNTQEAILLTGATGFLGAFLLEALIQESSATIYCLVRASDSQQAMERIAANLRGYLRPEGIKDRVVGVPGDLAQQNFGLTSQMYERLADQIDGIFHCGALVKWTHPFKSLKGPNVDGTREILRFAARRRIKPLHFISTVGVFSSPSYEAPAVSEEELLDRSGPLYVGYAQTKWVAEKLVTIARSRGLPVSIYRPNLASDSATGVFNPHDHISLLLRACVHVGLTPVLEFRVSGMPVDCAARAVLRLSKNPPPADMAYHLVNENDMSWNEFCKWFAARGLPLKQVPYPNWREAILKSLGTDRENALVSVLPFVSENIFNYARLPRFECSRTLRLLEGSGLACPAIDDTLLGTFLNYYRTRGYFLDEVR